MKRIILCNYLFPSLLKDKTNSCYLISGKLNSNPTFFSYYDNFANKPTGTSQAKINNFVAHQSERRYTIQVQLLTKAANNANHLHVCSHNLYSRLKYIFSFFAVRKKRHFRKLLFQLRIYHSCQEKQMHFEGSLSNSR